MGGRAERVAGRVEKAVVHRPELKKYPAFEVARWRKHSVLCIVLSFIPRAFCGAQTEDKDKGVFPTTQDNEREGETTRRTATTMTTTTTTNNNPGSWLCTCASPEAARDTPTHVVKGSSDLV